MRKECVFIPLPLNTVLKFINLKAAFRPSVIVVAALLRCH